MATRQDLMGVLPGMMAFKEDPFVGKTQDYLFPYGKGIMEGDIPDYYKGIGESGGKEFEDLLGLVTRGTEESVYGAGARAGIRGPRLAASMGREVGDISKKMRFEDYMRALEGKKWLFGQGRGITEGVRGAGLTQQAQENQQRQALAQMMMGLGERDVAASEAKKEAQKQRDADFWESIIGGAGTVAGMAMLGPLGAGGGGMLGSAAGGGGRMSAGGWLEGLDIPMGLK